MHDPLDHRLQEPGQQAVRRAVAQLPEDAPSLAWRAELNEKLIAASRQKQRKDRWVFWGRPGLAVACSVVLAAVIWMRPDSNGSLVTERSLEAQIVQVHSDSEALSEVPFTSALGAPDSGEGSAQPQWEASDLDFF
jgi:hypothetical protein